MLLLNHFDVAFLIELVRLNKRRINMLLNGENGINKLLHRFRSVIHLVLMNTVGSSGHALDHIAVSNAEACIVLEKITVSEYVRHDQLVLNK
ncbi:hypothetical protein D3C78_1094130 [compost metagenome]